MRTSTDRITETIQSWLGSTYGLERCQLNDAGWCKLPETDRLAKPCLPEFALALGQPLPPPDLTQDHHPMEHDPEYSVHVRDKKFILTQSQIEFDAPNYFTTCFLGEFREAQTRRLRLSRNPDLFEIVLDYLCGYKVFPLSEKSIPRRMSLETTLSNLRADAVFYQLNGLAQAYDEFTSSLRQDPDSDKTHVALLCLGNYINGAEAATIFTSELEDYSTVFISTDQLSKPPFEGLFRVDSGVVGFSGLRTLGAVESVLAHKLGDSYHRKWRLIGWKLTPQASDVYEVVILAE